MQLDKITSSPVIILGGGPAGLSTAYFYAKKGMTAIVVEKSAVTGGLSRCVEFNGEKYDRGPHSFYSQYSETSLHFFTDLLGENNYSILAPKKILTIGRKNIYSPFNRSNLAFMLLATYSMLMANILPKKTANHGGDVFINKFGKSLFKKIFDPYCKKYFGLPAEKISPRFTHLLYQSKPGKKRKKETLYISNNGTVGEVWEKAEAYILSKGHRIIFNADIKKIEINNQQITSIIIGDEEFINPVKVISTLPAVILAELMGKNIPETGVLQTRATILLYLEVISIDTDALYLTDYDEKNSIGRISFCSNWKPEKNKTGKKTICVEFWCDVHDKIWEKESSYFLEQTLVYLQKNKVCDVDVNPVHTLIKIPKVFPVLKKGYEEIIETHLSLFGEITNLSITGRHGTFSWDGLDNSIIDANKIVNG